MTITYQQLAYEQRCQISGWLLNDQERLISYASIYLHIWANKQAVGDLYMYLRRPRAKSMASSR
ncbi:MAG: hypothetical protein QS721_02935 [Candidatus Endonucleobacter sp. (ex Gigantidas childressi)]|nr:hypothetical protein [Candidatus Endonucleobacter sp. (ex Gigantidas childressi)]